MLAILLVGGLAPLLERGDLDFLAIHLQDDVAVAAPHLGHAAGTPKHPPRDERNHDQEEEDPLRVAAESPKNHD